MNLSRRTTAIVTTAVGLVAIGSITGAVLATRDDAPPPQRLLDDATAMGLVELAVNDLDVVGAYYTEAVGLDVMEEGDGGVTLGLGEVELIRLVDADLSPRTAGSAGLYHSAILFADASSLADTIIQVATVAPESFAGASDHRVSQAFYFSDPEGNGLELYVDRPRDDWQWRDGEVTMGSEYLDANTFVNAWATGRLDDREAVMGHVHLSVGDLVDAEGFYSDLIGMDVTSRSTGALFMSAGGYHHHLAANIWNSQGAGERGDEFGLSRFTITVGDAADLEGIAMRLDTAGWDYETTDSGIVVDDPWGNTVVVTS